MLKMEETMQHFQHIMLCYFKKGKTATETQKRFMQYVDSLDNAPQSGRPVEVDIDQIETLIETSQTLYHVVGDNQHTQNNQVNKVIGENEKCVFHFTKKNQMNFLANPTKPCSVAHAFRTKARLLEPPQWQVCFSLPLRSHSCLLHTASPLCWPSSLSQGWQRPSLLRPPVPHQSCVSQQDFPVPFKLRFFCYLFS